MKQPFDLQFENNDFIFIIKTSIVFGIISFLFSIIGLFMPTAFVIGNPLEVSSPSYDHILGHVGWGLIAGLFSFSLRYCILSGLFPLILDSDHLIQFLDIAAVPRMAHSLTFAILVFFLMMIIFGRKDYRLGTISLAAIFTHISYDIIRGDGGLFPFLMPFGIDYVLFPPESWFITFSFSVGIILVGYFGHRKNVLINEHS